MTLIACDYYFRSRLFLPSISLFNYLRRKTHVLQASNRSSLTQKLPSSSEAPDTSGKVLLSIKVYQQVLYAISNHESTIKIDFLLLGRPHIPVGPNALNLIALTKSKCAVGSSKNHHFTILLPKLLRVPSLFDAWTIWNLWNSRSSFKLFRFGKDKVHFRSVTISCNLISLSIPVLRKFSPTAPQLSTVYSRESTGFGKHHQDNALESSALENFDILSFSRSIRIPRFQSDPRNGF